jgi:KipI family sensor histidine kinase inhibitor
VSPECKRLSDQAIVVNFPNRIEERISQEIRVLTRRLKEELGSRVLDIVPGFRQIVVTLDPLTEDPEGLLERIDGMTEHMDRGAAIEKEVIEIPVCYDAPFDLDTEEVCAHLGIDRKELVERHTSRDYLIYMIGFTPGFPYLGGMDEGLTTPRKEQPRQKIPAGSVGIAGPQTGIYPIESPGGWQIIGRTPLKLFDPESADPVLLSAGQYVRFYPISYERYQDIERGDAS